MIEEAAVRAIQDSWPEMPKDERASVVEAVAGFKGLAYQWAISRRGRLISPSGERILLDEGIAGPRILVRAYATAEADTLRMRNHAKGQSSEAGQPSDPEERLRRYLPHHRVRRPQQIRPELSVQPSL